MNKLILLWTITTINMAALQGAEALENTILNYSQTTEMENDHLTKLLSRRKRFLVFPDGSSFQLVFCTQSHGYLQVGDIVWFGNTAALAWELPSDPQLFHLLKDETKLNSNRRMDSDKHIYYLDEDGKVLAKVPYHRRPLVNPAFAKRSIDANAPPNNEYRNKISVKEMHSREKQKNHYQHLDERGIEFHRQNRKELYVKFEKLLQGLGWNGDECVLRMLCEAAKNHTEQGTFYEELVKATFTLPRGRGFDSQLKYDVAHGTGGDCGHVYPDCRML